jgi:hypothetical protein
MAILFQAYTDDGAIQGHLAGQARLIDQLEAGTALTLEMGRQSWLDGREPATFVREMVDPDRVVVVAAPAEQVVPSHAVWHDLDLVAGPWSIQGAMPTLPGFDPSRALTRPSGSFVLLAGVSVGAADDSGSERDRDGRAPAHPFAFVNRYTVERVTADLELGFFFPGAASEVRAQGGPVQLPR